MRHVGDYDRSTSYADDVHAVAQGGQARRRRRELMALIEMMMRFWLLTLPLARSELRGWQQAAATIPDPELRGQALATLRSERLSAAGAALFATTARRHDAALVRALIAFQVAWDYLDTLAEQPGTDPIANGARLHSALTGALEPGRAHDDYYRLHRARDDGGYLEALVDACRHGCTQLPAFARVRETAIREAARAQVQGINHAPQGQRESALRRWAARQRDVPAGIGWIELGAAGSSSLGLLALIALAADAATTDVAVEQVRAAYFPWIDALTTLLDSLVDRDEDAATGALNFIGQYASEGVATERLGQLTARAIAGARELPRGERHVVLVAGMIAMHLSSARAWLPVALPATQAVLREADTIVMRLLLMILRVWRMLLTPCQRTPVFNSE
jgi:tetraprenyl-beta-curcumene synthase